MIFSVISNKPNEDIPYNEPPAPMPIVALPWPMQTQNQTRKLTRPNDTEGLDLSRQGGFGTNDAFLPIRPLAASRRYGDGSSKVSFGVAIAASKIHTAVADTGRYVSFGDT